MSGDHTSSTEINKDKLVNDLGLKQYKNTTIFEKYKIFVLSPSVQSESNWFDVREINIQRYDKNQKKGLLLIRYFKKFLVADLDIFLQDMTSTVTKVYNGHGGERWKFSIQESKNENGEQFYNVINQEDRELKMKFEMMDLEILKQLFNITKT